MSTPSSSAPASAPVSSSSCSSDGCHPGYTSVQPPLYYYSTHPLSSDSEAALVASATPCVTTMLFDCLQFTPATNHLFVLYDRDTALSRVLSSAYHSFISVHCRDPSLVTFLDFSSESANDILQRLEQLKENDAVILVQSLQFRLNDYRIRIELFKRKIKTIEHVHACIIPPNEYQTYIAALAFSPTQYGPLARSLKHRVDSASAVVVESGSGSVCKWEGGMQPCKLNIGDYSETNGVGGSFPIGEVFTEAKNLKGVNGKLAIWGYPSLGKTLVVLDQPIIMEFKSGILQFEPEKGIEPENCTEEYRKLMNLIRDGEGEIMIREFGMGLNEGMAKDKTVQDIFAFERQYGLHVSLGRKHNVYAAEGISKKKTRFHIDVFVMMTSIVVDDLPLFVNGRYTES